MTVDINQKLEQICRLFRIEGTYVTSELIQMGNVNKTYECKFILPDGTPKSFLVQNVNTYAFRHPVELMENIDKVTEHIRAKKPGQIALHFHHTEDRKTYVEDGKNFWRMTNYISSVTYDTPPNLELINNAGKAFGEFQMQLADFKPEDLFETIPDFHNTRSRFEKLLASVKADPVGRVAEVREELDWLLSVQDLACKLTDMQKAGQLPLRVTHNDTKINNVLFRKDSYEPLVVIDLDTVMPGLVGHDFGDAIRFAANRVREDSRDYDKAGVDLDVFKAFAQGFLGMTARTLTEAEIDTLALSCFVLTVELSTRFLADYIDGDLYFKILTPDHNLVRTRCQVALAKDMLKKMPQMEQIVRECAAEACM
ncbi:MAG: aminoglycoside phosphotransferase family protein [Ruminococcaceae bacterium]|nr:aminoglycoside phosphotransferase family protein [Oscillospiraceae bacterium]